MKSLLTHWTYVGKQKTPNLLTVLFYRKCFWNIDDIDGCTGEIWLLLRSLSYDEEVIQGYGKLRYNIMELKLKQVL